MNTLSSGAAAWTEANYSLNSKNKSLTDEAANEG